MELRVSTVDDVEFDGQRCTATFYCTVQTDPGAAAALKEMGLT